MVKHEYSVHVDDEEDHDHLYNDNYVSKCILIEFLVKVWVY